MHKRPLVPEENLQCLSKAQQALLMRAALAAFAAEGLAVPAAAGLTLCGNADIRAVNREQRGIDSATDVLSFPTVRYPNGETAARHPERLKKEWSSEYGACFLGDILISLDTAQKQAAEYGHAFERELCYLLVHGLFHLMGYDHMDEREKKRMREKEEQALSAIGMRRVGQEEMLAKAVEAMRHAYVPYSHFKVGACLMTESGALYTGCNVENASYGLTNCAERTAVFKAVSEGHTAFSAIAIAAEGIAAWPCGACRQVLSEFCADMPVYITWDGHTDQAMLSELLPRSFSPANGVSQHLGKEKNI